MSAGGLSYSGLRTQAKVTLPSVDSWGTNMNILKRPTRSVQTRRIDKVGQTQNILMEQDDSGDRIAEMIQVYARGVNPMVSVSYDNASNNSGALKANMQGIGQASLPYKVQNVRPPVFRQEDLLPLSRLPRVWNEYTTNPQFPDFKNQTLCSTTKKSIVEESRLLHIPVDSHTIDNTRPTITEDAIRELPSHSILPETVWVIAKTQKGQQDRPIASLPSMLLSHQPTSCLSSSTLPTTSLETTKASSQQEQEGRHHLPTSPEDQSKQTSKAIDRQKQIYEAFTFLTGDHRKYAQTEGWTDLKKTVKENILLMNARTPYCLPSVGDTSTSTLSTTRTIETPLNVMAHTQKTDTDRTIGIEESFGSNVDARNKTSQKVEIRDQETIRSAPHRTFAMDRLAEESHDSRMAEKPMKLSATLHDISSRLQQERTHLDVMINQRKEDDPIVGQRSTSRLPEMHVESSRYTSEQRHDILPSSFYDPMDSSSLPSTMPIQRERTVVSLESQKSQPSRYSGNEQDNRILQTAALHDKLQAKDTYTQKTYLAQSHPYAQSDVQEWKYQKNVPLYSLSTSESSPGEQEGMDHVESYMTERPGRLTHFSEAVGTAPMYTGFHSEGSMPSRDIQHRLHGGKCLPKQGFLHNQRGVDFFQHQQRATDVDLGPTVNDWTSTKQRASLAMQERFRL